ncbi:hypothetical protein GOP47_0006788, partial [Adiantum capillus-veneris]
KNSKKIDLAEPREELRPAYIMNDLTEEEEELLLSLLKEYPDIFAWSYKDLKGVDPEIYQHTIPIRDDVKPSRQRPYTLKRGKWENHQHINSMPLYSPVISQHPYPLANTHPNTQSANN